MVAGCLDFATSGPPSWAHTWKVTLMVISARWVAVMGNGTRISRIDTFVLNCLQGGGIGNGMWATKVEAPLLIFKTYPSFFT